MPNRKGPHMPEGPFQEKITDLCGWLRLRWHHETDSRRSKAGFPDLVIVGRYGTVFAELKSTSGKISAEQQAWHDDLVRSGAEAYIWRPEDWDEVQSVLKRLADGPSER